MIEMISSLITKGFAYEKNNHVYFEVNKFEDYGKLSNKKLEDLIAGSRVEVSENKKNAEDFVLWKPSSMMNHFGTHLGERKTWLAFRMFCYVKKISWRYI